MRSSLGSHWFSVSLEYFCSISTDLYIGETKQLHHEQMAQQRRANSSDQDSAVHLHLKETNHSFKDYNVDILRKKDKMEDRWFWRGIKQSICVKLEQLSLNRGGDLWDYLSPTDNGVLSSLHRHLNNHSHQGSPSSSDPHEGLFGQRPTSGPKDSETQNSCVSLTTL